MKKTIFVFCVAALFIGTTFAGANVLKTTDDRDIAPNPSNDGDTPGIKNFYLPNAKFWDWPRIRQNFIEVERGNDGTVDVIYRITLDFKAIYGKANEIEIKYHGDTFTDKETLTIDLADDLGGRYTYDYTVTYNTPGKQKLYITSIAKNEEKSWNDISKTLTAYVDVERNEIKNDKNTEPGPVPCPTVVLPPGLWNTGYKSGGKVSVQYGMWKHVKIGEEVTYQSEMSFVKFGSGAVFTIVDGEMVKIPSYANKIIVTIKERKNGGLWQTICEETITPGQASGDGFYVHRHTKSYSEDGKYEVEVSAVSYGNTLLHGEISWRSGGGKLYTMTTAVGATKSKAMPLINLLDRPIFQLLNQFLKLDAIF